MTDAQPTDIEIYIEKLAMAEASAWLGSVFEDLTSLRKQKGMPKTAQPFQATWQGSPFQILIFENAIPGYTSIWLDSANLPWSDDLACATVAAAHFSKSVRITAGGWEDQNDPDNWLEIKPDGSTKELVWKT